ncbi:MULTISPECIES: response regulator [unclassified Paenibacillus]|uniref:response regulator n=1 Tax=unclassified Paenibacillus TaxID=185978 RepID=UPI000955E0B5|nr:MULTISPECIES: response regulator [unclassified Paenibacillus]ASS68356.1 response regulator [Paenibacillus sp. RUD330]SIR30211.1 Signal transduction histidine kinase [Paenibacillus sp. RU4X]SIR42080.1 Signal transduction histidine kinase [Paenibacillus sp. RU4T]
MQSGMAQIAGIAQRMEDGEKVEEAAPAEAAGEFSSLAATFRSLADTLFRKTEQERSMRLEAEEQAWINASVSEMAILLQGSIEVEAASRIFIGKLAAAVDASYGSLYVRRDAKFHFAAGYAHDAAELPREPIQPGQGLVGQCALDKAPLELRHIPEGYIRIQSALGAAVPSSLLIVPVLYEGEAVAVLELASFREFAGKERQLIDRVSRNMGVLINTLADVARIDGLLRETQNQKEELEAQTEELQAQTEELQHQKEELKAQADELHLQSVQLEQTNGQLRLETEMTARQKEQIESQFLEEQAQAEQLRLQAEELLAQTEQLKEAGAMALAQKEEIERQADELKDQAEELRLSNEGLREQMELTERQKQELQLQTEELQAQTEELQAQTDELLAQSEELQAQTDELKVQAEELELSNHSLQEQMGLTERQKIEIKAQADEIYLAAQHKSEFLANVSHELRTPLNSLLILSQILAENKEGNLRTKQLEYIHTIYSSGKDLLQLIDEILDLAKLETGKMTPVIEDTGIHGIADQLYRMFELQAQKKSIAFDIRMDRSLPASILTDGHRVQQIVRNLLSNALKFTEEGSVSLHIGSGSAASPGAGQEEIVFAVADTGIGIPASKLEAIFEAFQQADGTTSRKYGGTGLGLTISRELAGLLGGRIEASSTAGQGSIFSLIIPVRLPEAAASKEAEPISIASESERSGQGKFMESFVPDISISNPKLLQFSEMEDDRDDLQQGDTVLLIIEDDADFAAILLEIARRRGFKAIVAFQGDQGLALAHAYKPDAILLDTDLPVLDGWSIISRLKSRPELRHIPVHVISTEDRNQQTLSLGALSFWKKPNGPEELEAAFLDIESYIRRRVKSLLIVEDNADLRKSLVAYIAHPDVRITAVGTGREAMEQLAVQHFDCMVLDLGLADISGFDLLEQVKTNRKLQTLPVTIYTGKELGKQDEQKLKHYAESIVIKNVRSMERLYDETALYLHRRTADLPPDKQRIIEKLHNPEAAFEGRRILLVDDDMRNIFALSSVLEGYNMDIQFAQNGKEALAMLQGMENVDLVFMDIMMPEMDGYETMRAIRAIPAYDSLVIIALTARAMEEDRIKCLDAGASDYIPKPINTTQLVTMLKSWLIN